MTDTNYSPWPAPGKWFYWTNRDSVMVDARPDYDRNYPSLSLSDVESIRVEFGKHWFFSFNIAGLVHGYFGSPPINLEDLGFYWQNHPKVGPYLHQGLLFVEPWWRLRLGFGGIS